MNSQKLENLLNLALDSTMEEREKSLDLVSFRKWAAWRVPPLTRVAI